MAAPRPHAGCSAVSEGGRFCICMSGPCRMSGSCTDTGFPPLARWLRLVLLAGALLASPLHLVAAQGRNHLFFEVGGSGLLYSANYERLVGSSWGLRLGTSSANIGVLDYTANFAGLTWIPGGGRRGLELGFALGALEVKHFIFFSSDQPSRVLYGSFTLGYRWLPKVRGLSFRLAATPLFTADGAAPWAGVSLGYVF